jgi:hypothetical protein
MLLRIYVLWGGSNPISPQLVIIRKRCWVISGIWLLCELEPKSYITVTETEELLLVLPSLSVVWAKIS